MIVNPVEAWILVAQWSLGVALVGSFLSTCMCKLWERRKKEHKTLRITNVESEIKNMKERENIKDFKLYTPSQVDMDDERLFLDNLKVKYERREQDKPNYLLGPFGYDMNKCRPIPGTREKEDSITIYENMLETLSMIEESDHEASSPDKSKTKHDAEANSITKNGQTNDYKDLGDKNLNDQTTREDVIDQGTSQVESRPAEVRFNRLMAARKSYKEGPPLKSLLHKL